MQVNKKRIIYRNIHLIYVQYVRQYIHDMDVYIYIHSICYIFVDFLCPSRAGRQLPHSCLYLSLPPPTPTPFPKNNLQQISRLPSSTFKSPIKSIFHPHPKFNNASSTEKDWLSGAWSGISVFQLPSSPPLILALTKLTGDASAVSTEASMDLKQSEFNQEKMMDVSCHVQSWGLELNSWNSHPGKTNTVMHIRPMPRVCPLCIWPPTHTTYNNLNRWPAHHKAGTIQGDMEPGASKSPEDLSPMVLQSTSRDIENIQIHGCHGCIVVFQFIPEPLFKNWVCSGIQMCPQLPPNMSKNIKNQLHPSNTSGSFLVVQYNSKLPRAA